MVVMSRMPLMRHVQCAGDGRGRQREHVHADESLFQLFLVLDAEALLLVDDDQAQIMELYILVTAAGGCR